MHMSCDVLIFVEVAADLVVLFDLADPSRLGAGGVNVRVLTAPHCGADGVGCSGALELAQHGSNVSVPELGYSL